MDEKLIKKIVQEEINKFIVNYSPKELGFLGKIKGSKPTITGSRGSNAALSSLLTALANLGLIKDSTS